MAAQPTLFDAPAGRVRRTDPQTSVDAARSITPGRTEKRILVQFRYASSTFTDDELCDKVLGYAPTIKSARSRLSNAGLLVDSGRRRKSNRGRDQIVWRLA